MFLLKYLALGVGYLLAAYGCFMLLGGIGNDHIALPLAGLLLLYGWYALSRAERGRDVRAHPLPAAILAHLPLVICMIVDVTISDQIGSDKVTWFYAWGMPLRLPISMIIRPMELLAGGRILLEYGLTLLLLVAFFCMGQKQVPLKGHTLALPALAVVIRETGILPVRWSQLLLLLWPLWYSWEYWKRRSNR